MLDENIQVKVGDELALIDEDGEPLRVVTVEKVTRNYIVAGHLEFHQDGTSTSDSRQLRKVTQDLLDRIESRNILERLETGSASGLSLEQLKRIEAILDEED